MPPGPKTQLVLQKFTEVPDGMGGVTETWQAMRKMKGVLISLSGREQYVTGKTEVFRTHKFVVAYPIGITITEKDRFTLGARVFEIQVVVDSAEQHRNLEIELLEVE